MNYDNIKLVKIVSGETVLGEYSEEGLKDIAIVQVVPTQTGEMQMMIIPFGFPFDEKPTGLIKEEHIIYHFENVPEEIIEKYIESKSNIKIKKNLNFDPSGSNSGLIL